MTDQKFQTVRHAGYRERAFLKSLLVSDGYAEQWPHALDVWLYDPSADVVFRRSGIEPLIRRAKVDREGTRSKEILLEHGYDDEGCEAPPAPEPEIVRTMRAVADGMIAMGRDLTAVVVMMGAVTVVARARLRVVGVMVAGRSWRATTRMIEMQMTDRAERGWV